MIDNSESGFDIDITISGHGGPPVVICYRTRDRSTEAREHFVNQVCYPPIAGSIEMELRRRLGVEFPAGMRITRADPK